MGLWLHSSAPHSVTFRSADFAKPCCERLGRGSGGKGSPHCSPVSLSLGCTGTPKGGQPPLLLTQQMGLP